MNQRPADRDAIQGPDLPLRAVRALFFLSGAAAMALEVLWMRRFAELLGATAPAAAATLTGVFLGLALGGFLAARFAARITRPLRTYARLELVAAGGALLVLPLLDASAAILPPLRSALAATPTLARLAETLLAALIVLLPATCMGATLPIVAPALGAGGGRALYTMNLLGAIGGAIAVPFVLLPMLGVTAAYVVVVALGASAGAIAWWCARSERVVVTDTPATAKPQPDPPAPPATTPGIDSLPARTLAFTSGAMLLGLEAAYTRLFAQVHESSLHAFAAVIAAFLLALTIGAALAQAAATRLAMRNGERGEALAVAWLVAAVLLAATPTLFAGLTDGLAPLPGAAIERALRLLGLALLLLVPPIALAGTALPLLLGPLRRAPERARLGTLLGWNTLGAVAGPLLFTFVLFPSIGLFGSFALASLALALFGGALLLRRSAASRRRGRSLALLTLLLAAIAAFAAAAPPRVRIDRALGEELIELVEGPLCIAATIARPAGPDGERAYSLKIDNHYTLGGTGATGDLRALGHLPLLLHPAPRRVGFLGLGTAITAGAATLHPVDTIELVELLPEAIALARRHFAGANLGVLDAPPSRLHVDDARTFLRGRDGTFDVLVGDLIVPWRAGESALYTREHFAQAHAALAPGGLFCQWLPAYQLRTEQLDAVIATFLDVFPRATLWRGDFVAALPTLGLIGHTADVDPAAVAARAAALAPRLDAVSPYLMHVAGVWLSLIGPLDPTAPRWRDARRHTGDSPWLELAGPERGSGSAATTLIGHALDPLQEQVMAAPLAGTPLTRLGGDELRWRAAGAALWRASTLALDGRGREANDLGVATLESLPPPLRRAVLGR